MNSEHGTRIASTGKAKTGVQREIGEAQVSPTLSGFSCKVDVSWKPPWKGGLGFVVEEGTELKGYRAAPSMACCP